MHFRIYRLVNQAGLCKAREELDCSSNIQMIYLADKQFKSVVYLRNRKHCPCFFQVYRKTSGRVGERAVSQCLRSFYFFQTFTSMCFYMSLAFLEISDFEFGHFVDRSVYQELEKHNRRKKLSYI